MIVYTKDNIGKLFLSPYVELIYREQGVICHNKINGMMVAVKVQKEFFDKVRAGIFYEELKDYLFKTRVSEEPDMFIKKMIQKGVIE